VPRKRPPALWVAPFYQWIEEKARALEAHEPKVAAKLRALAYNKSLDPMRRQLMGQDGPSVRPRARLERAPPPPRPPGRAWLVERVVERAEHRLEMQRRKIIGMLPRDYRRRVCALGMLHHAVARLEVIDFGDVVRIRRERTHGILLKKHRAKATASRMIGPFLQLYGKPLIRPIRTFTKAITKTAISRAEVVTLIRHF
jgi:hypothetical protein